MNVLQTLRIALLDLSLHKFRSALATLGIIFGVASVEAMISISEGARRQTLAQIAVLGVDNLMIHSVKPVDKDAQSAQRNQRFGAGYGLLRRDIEHVRQLFPAIRYSVGVRDMRRKIYARGGAPTDVNVMATEPDYLPLTRSAMSRGRFLCEMDQRELSQVCVLGSDAARKIFLYNDPLGQRVRIGADWYEVVGVLDNRAGLKEAGGDDVNNYVFIPLATAHARYGDTSFNVSLGSAEIIKVQLDSIQIQLEDSDLVPATAARMENYLAATHKDKDYELKVPLALMRQKVATQRIFTVVMASIASISLLVGGIGIMNVMVANVSDRRKEIGTRRALGARRRDILRQFVFEAATLTTLGGAVGAAVGYGLARGVTHFAHWPTVITPASILLGLGVSFVTGVTFGLWPAAQAARVNPIEALRSD